MLLKTERFSPVIDLGHLSQGKKKYQCEDTLLCFYKNGYIHTIKADQPALEIAYTTSQR